MLLRVRAVACISALSIRETTFRVYVCGASPACHAGVGRCIAPDLVHCVALMLHKRIIEGLLPLPPVLILVLLFFCFCFWYFSLTSFPTPQQPQSQMSLAEITEAPSPAALRRKSDSPELAALNATLDGLVARDLYRETPLVHSRAMSAALGGRDVLVKLDCLQPTGERESHFFFG